MPFVLMGSIIYVTRSGFQKAQPNLERIPAYKQDRL
jgi:hypothetical protein